MFLKEYKSRYIFLLKAIDAQLSEISEGIAETEALGIAIQPKSLVTQINKMKGFIRDAGDSMDICTMSTSEFEYDSYDNQFLIRVIQIIEENISDPSFTINRLADMLNISNSSFYRKVKLLTGFSPHEFLMEIKLSHSCKMLKNRLLAVSEIAYSVGFFNPKYFTICFKKEYGMTPTQYRKFFS